MTVVVMVLLQKTNQIMNFRMSQYFHCFLMKTSMDQQYWVFRKHHDCNQFLIFATPRTLRTHHPKKFKLKVFYRPAQHLPLTILKY
jgi:hypothetical protein